MEVVQRKMILFVPVGVAYPQADRAVAIRNCSKSLQRGQCMVN